MRKYSLLTLACSFAISIAFALSPRGRAESAPRSLVVVELFTSQGCSSCPAADRVLAALADESDVLPLAFHVDYWDYLGWRDPFSAPWAAERQRAYAQFRGKSRIYTPQAIVDGRADVVGSDRAGLRAQIDAAREKPQLSVVLAPDTARSVRIEIDAHAPHSATLWLLGYDDRHQTAIKRGENAGKTISYRNVVRSLVRVADWSGGGRRLHSRPTGEHVAALLQAQDGAILGAARL